MSEQKCQKYYQFLTVWAEFVCRKSMNQSVTDMIGYLKHAAYKTDRKKKKKKYESLNILDKEFIKEAERTDSEKMFPRNKNNDSDFFRPSFQEYTQSWSLRLNVHHRC